MMVIAQPSTRTANSGTASACQSSPTQKLPPMSRAAALATAVSESSAVVSTISPISSPMPKMPATAMGPELASESMAANP